MHCRAVPCIHRLNGRMICASEVVEVEVREPPPPRVMTRAPCGGISICRLGARSQSKCGFTLYATDLRSHATSILTSTSATAHRCTPALVRLPSRRAERRPHRADVLTAHARRNRIQSTLLDSQLDSQTALTDADLVPAITFTPLPLRVSAGRLGRLGVPRRTTRYLRKGT